VNIIERIQRHGLLVVLLSFVWLILRSGEKPSRINYPCQQAAKANILTVVPLYFMPIFATVQPVWRKVDRRLIAAGIIILAVSAVGYSLFGQAHDVYQTPDPEDNDTVPVPTSSNSTTSKNSNIFVVSNYTGTNGGLADLINIMGENGAHFYRGSSGLTSGSDGLIAVDDVIIIKVNSQWDQRGGTNTDLLKELITLVLAHPDGFRGEIIVADNGQAQYGSLGRGGSFEWVKSNAEDKTQSVKKVVDSFTKAHVSTYRWDDITTKRVNEYSAGDDVDGYILEAGVDPETGLMVSYPKFTSKYGTHISLKFGVWDSEKKNYNSSCLKVINLPVLKTHGGYGVTGAVKSYMGVPSDKLTAAQGYRTHSLIDEGAMGTLMVETRFPTITILDCIWINAVPLSGPATSYQEATRVNVAAASVDPVALDYWASENILMKAAPKSSDTSSMNPDSGVSGSFGDWLRKSASEIAAAGLPAELDASKVGVYVTSVG
jgi:hypothetical protein